MRNFRNYKIYQDAMEIAKMTYTVTGAFPKSEIYALSAQLNRAAVSIASNIAEGASRDSEKDFAHFLEISLGSSFEVETQLVIAKDLGYDKEGIISGLLDKIQRIEKQINQLIRKIRPIANSQ
ncbi:MAG: four helix bundle protein [Bacteroidaceae bacterium]|jgi:four helix bundle protein|nr:four helix bundle protein [Bacteroidaceae bacterium]